MRRISLLTGAGFSYPFGYPTTKQFFEDLEKLVTDKNQLRIIKSMRNIEGVKDIEHVLHIIDDLLIEDQNNPTLKYLSTVIKNVTVIDAQYEKWTQFVNDLTKLKEQIIELIYKQYHFKHETQNTAFSSVSLLFSLLNQPKGTYSFEDIFTLNYDRIFEETLLRDNSNYKLIDGFKPSRGRRFWDRQAFDEPHDDNRQIVRLFKLHGSLNWREWKNGDIECVPTEEPSQNEYYRRNLFIYPTEECNESIEPYSTLYSHFKQIGQSTDVLLIIGYAFRDKSINNVITDFLQEDRKLVICVSPTIDEDVEPLHVTSNLPKIAHFTKVKGKFPEKDTLLEIRNKLSRPVI